MLLTCSVEEEASEIPPLKDTPAHSESRGRWRLWVTNGTAEEDDDQYDDESDEDDEVEKRERKKGNF